MLRTAVLLVCGLLLCGSCHQEAVEPLSLVGAQALASEAALSREAIYIVRGGASDDGDTFIYDWQPDGTLIIEHKVSNGRDGQEVASRETLHVPAETAMRVRRLLARVHPERLGGVEQDVRPLGCERLGSHDVGEITIGFIRPIGRPGIEDDEVGQFALPSSRSCDTPAAIEARRVVRNILQHLLSNAKAPSERSH